MGLDQTAEKLKDIIFDIRHIKNEIIKNANNPEYVRKLAKKLEELL